MAGGGTFRTTARVLPEAAALRRRPRTRKCRLQKSRRNFAEREALAYADRVVTEGEHPPSGRLRHSAHIAEYERINLAQLSQQLIYISSGYVQLPPLGTWRIQHVMAFLAGSSR